jgi:hypothetical protein
MSTPEQIKQGIEWRSDRFLFSKTIDGVLVLASSPDDIAVSGSRLAAEAKTLGMSEVTLVWNSCYGIGSALRHESEAMFA